MSKVAVVAGGSGMTGTELLHQLCASKAYSRIILLVRRPLEFMHAKVKEYVVNFEQLDKAAAYIKGDVFFCCLGTHLKKTHDTRQYYHIDHDYTVQLAHIAATNGIRQFHLLSALNAHAGSRLFFFLNIKGETERDIASLPFEAIHIYQPFVLAGMREEPRLSERIAVMLLSLARPLLQGSRRKYRSIAVRDVAKAMIRQSLTTSGGIHYYHPDDMQRIADTAPAYSNPF